MPPYFMVNDDVSLTADQKSTIAASVDGGTPEGTPSAPLERSAHSREDAR